MVLRRRRAVKLPGREALVSSADSWALSWECRIRLSRFGAWGCEFEKCSQGTLTKICGCWEVFVDWITPDPEKIETHFGWVQAESQLAPSNPLGIHSVTNILLMMWYTPAFWKLSILNNYSWWWGTKFSCLPSWGIISHSPGKHHILQRQNNLF